jgi:hypothetical protein
MSKEIKARVGLLSTAPATDDYDTFGVPEGKVLVGFYLPLERLDDIRFSQDVVITVPEVKS